MKIRILDKIEEDSTWKEVKIQSRPTKNIHIRNKSIKKSHNRAHTSLVVEN
jgi:hypothetical protein